MRDGFGGDVGTTAVRVGLGRAAMERLRALCVSTTVPYPTPPFETCDGLA